MANETKPGVIGKVRKYAKDGWSNLITGLNAAATAKKRQTRHRYDGLITDQELESMYAEDGLAARIVDLLVDDMFREGWKYQFPTLEELEAEKLSEQYMGVIEAVSAYQKCAEGLKWARLYGGSIILIGVTDGMTPDKPLNPKRIKTFENLKVIDRTDVDFQKIEFQTDPMKPRYGLPEYYSIKYDVGPNLQAETRVHYSRVIEIHGASLPGGASTFSAEQRYWGLSVLQRVEDHLKTLGSSLGSIDQLLNEMSVGKYKIKDLANLLSTPEGKEAIQRRVELMDLTRSVFRSQYLDAGGGGESGEDYSRDEVTFTGVPEVLYIIFMLVAADTGYPITRLFGVSPAGMNSTGESDMRNYYDAVRSRQTFLLQPILLRLVKIIAEWLNIEEPYIEFDPLQTMNEKEQAELEEKKALTESTKANTYKTYIDAGILEPYEARFLEFGDALDKIPAPEEESLPPVETVEPPPPAGEDNPDDQNQDPEMEEDDEGEEEPEDIEARIAELEGKEELSEEEQKELDELIKQARKTKGKAE
jgi:phage-related protein (TIGR01555 family)